MTCAISENLASINGATASKCSWAARIKVRELELSESLSQKQMMLREIHHRVKNNLQTVTSLLNLYARIPRGEAIKQAFADVQTRINALALVHRHLYESQDLREIDLATFMSNLCRLVQDGSGVPAKGPCGRSISHSNFC